MPYSTLNINKIEFITAYKKVCIWNENILNMKSMYLLIKTDIYLSSSYILLNVLNSS